MKINLDDSQLRHPTQKSMILWRWCCTTAHFYSRRTNNNIAFSDYWKEDLELQPTLQRSSMVRTSSQPPQLYNFTPKISKKLILSPNIKVCISPLVNNYNKNKYHPLFVIFERNDFVEANHNGNGYWFYGMITQVFKNGFYEIQYNSDGVREIVGQHQQKAQILQRRKWCSYPSIPTSYMYCHGWIIRYQT